MSSISPDDAIKTPRDPNERYRVRDAVPEDGKPVNIWGENLNWDAAVRLKEAVVGAEKSRSARIEPMTVDIPNGRIIGEVIESPQVVDAIAQAMAAARVQAQAAQVRANAVIQPPIPVIPNPPIDIEIPEDDLGSEEVDADADMPALDDHEVAEYESGGKALYEAWVELRLAAGEDGWEAWEQCTPHRRATFCFEAQWKQGDRFDDVKRAEQAQRDRERSRRDDAPGTPFDS